MKSATSLRDFIFRYRWFIALLSPILAFVLIFSSAKHFGFEADVSIWFGKDSKELKDYAEFKNNFGNDDQVMVVFRDEKGIFNQKALGSIERITEALWQTKHIIRVDSLRNFQHIHANEDDVIVEDFYEDASTLDQEALDRMRAIALDDIQVKDFMISKDATTTTIYARMAPQEKVKSEVYIELRGLIEKILEKEKELTGYKYYLNGVPIVSTEFALIAGKDAIFTPIITIATIILLFFVFRRASGAFLPPLIVILTAMSVMAMQALFGFKFNNFTANVPVFIIAIGIADSVHIYWVWLLSRQKGMDNLDAIAQTLHKNFKPALFTSITTFVGFMSLAPSSIVPIKTLGIATASASIIAFVLSIMFMPAVLAILNPKVKIKHEEHTVLPFASSYANYIMRNDKTILGVTIVLLAVFAVGLFRVQIDSEAIKYFKEGTYIRNSSSFVEKYMTGPATYEVIVDSMSASGIKEPKFLQEIERFTNEYQQRFHDVRHVSSLLDVIKRFHKVMNGDKEEYYKVPENKELIAQYLLLYSLSLPQGMDINDRMDVNERLLRVSAAGNMTSSNEGLEKLDWIKAWWAKTDYGVTIQGQNAMYTYMQGDVIRTLIQSVVLALILVTIVMLIAFKSVKAMLMSIFPNIFPVILSVGFMGWMGLNLDIGVAISGAIIIGVAIDDTIHFLVKYRDARQRGLDVKAALEYMITYAGSAIVFTTIILALAFSIFMFSSFVPNHNFGMITAIALIIALATDLLMLPALFSLFDRRKK